MRIKASDMERMFRMSPNGIRLYEKNGIISPERSGSGSYRTYGENEMQAMGFGVQLRRYGFSMPETAELLGGADEAAQLSAMQRQTDVLETEIDRLMRVRKSLKANIQRAMRAKELLNVCAEEVKPAMYFLRTRRGEQFIGEDVHEQIGEWVDRYAPHLSTATVLAGRSIMDPDFECEPLFGVAVDAEVALELGLLASENLTYMPPKQCVVTAVKMEGGEIRLDETLHRVRAYALERGVKLHRGGVIRWVQCVRKGEQLITLGLLWVPLEEEEARAGIMR